MKDLMLVIADQEHGESPALAKASHLAKALGLNVSLFKFLSNHDPSDANTPQAVAAELETLQQEARDCFYPSTDVNIQVHCEADISGFISKTPELEQAALVVKTGHRSEKLFHTPTDFKLIRQLPCDILIASEQAWHDKPKVIATVDLDHQIGYHFSQNFKVLEHGRNIAHKVGGELHAVFSLPADAAMILGADKHPQDSEDDVICPESMAALQALLAKADITDAVPHIISGNVKDSVPQLAQHIGADLIVVGSKGRDGIAAMIFGNTAEQMLHNVRCDCLIVK